MIRPSEWSSFNPPGPSHDEDVAICPICEQEFDERAYQLVISSLGAFDTIACAEEAVRRRSREERDDLGSVLLEAVRDDPPAPARSDEPASPPG